ncbi:FAD-dependent oxidoreductase [Gammaproteobacteria bacterium]|nr:FAD-dependent oxidoreductase [Gammaproteobacteria bacterium]
MKTHAQAVVIGGGLIGCSILYHLAKLGWKDVILLERDELTSGSTWHAAANIHGLHDSNNISRLQHYTMGLYRELEQETGQSCGIHQTGSIYLAQTVDREHQLRIQAAKARYYGLDFHEIGLDDVQAMHPLVNIDGIRAAMYEPLGGRVDPSGVTHAYAQGARARGAEIYRFTPALETQPRADGGWDVVTPKGTIHTEILINAAGLWGREVAKLAGVELPLMTMEHQYLVTEAIAEIAELSRELPSVADRDGEYYLRQEGHGLLVGAYEKDGRFWAEDGTPLDFGHELLDDDLDRIADNYMRAVHRIPALENAGIRRVINGPMIWSPDAAALFGPVPELSNYWCCNGIIPGFSQSGGLGSMLAQWIVEGECELDLLPWDMARYGQWADKRFAKARALDCYSHRFKIHFPYEERDAGRPVRTRPVYAKQKALGAVFGLNYGWEHPLWFGDASRETYGFERQAWFEPVGEECRALRDGVGIIDISNFAKYEISGAGGGDWLDSIVANHVPKTIGRSCLAPLLGVRGGIAGDFTIARLAEDRLLMIGSGMAERYHQRFFQRVPLPQGVRFSSRTEALCGFNIAGPNSRQLLSRLTDLDLSSDSLPFSRAASGLVAGCEATILRVSFTGDLGYEVYVNRDDQIALYDALLEQGAALGARPVGSRALMSLRLEKGYGSWSREYSPEYWPQECGLERLIKDDKPQFLGRDAWLALKDKPARWSIVHLAINAENADATGGEPIFLADGTPIGNVTSGAYGYTVDMSLALGYLKSRYAVAGTEVDVYVLGRPHKARVLAQAPFDPQGKILRQ